MEMNIGREEQGKKKYDPLDSTLTFVDRGNDLDPMDDEDCLRAEMSCGHAVTPGFLTQYCRSQLDEIMGSDEELVSFHAYSATYRQVQDGIYKFRCPAVGEGTTKCNQLWSYEEVRRLADLSVEEMQHFEESISRLAAGEYCEIQPCPQCKTSVQRKSLSNLCVQCTICTADLNKTYQFCWQCKKEWKGPGPRSDRCNNDHCTNADLQLLQTCKTIALPQVQGVTACPSVRVCPTCGLKVEHNQQNCKNLRCPRCKVEFCFVCLKLKRECSKTSTPFKLCPGGVAPRQTAIPVWQRK